MNQGMMNPYYAGRFVVGLNNVFNYKQIIANIIHNARVYNSDYILLTADTNSANTIIKELNKNKINLEYANMEGETLICIQFNDNMVNNAKKLGIKIF